MALLSKFGTR